MRQSLYLLSPVLVLLSVSAAVAQTLTTDAPPEQKAWEVAIKMIFPILMTAVGPYLTGLITSSFAKVPAPVQYVISSLLGLLMGAIAGQVPGFPLGSESAANMGLAGGATGQFLANSTKADFHPKTEAAKVEIASLPKSEQDANV